MLRRFLGILLPLAGSALAVWLSTIIIPGISTTATTTSRTVTTVLLVAVIFGVVNTVVKPVAKLFGFPFYLLTLGLVALVVNGLLLWLTSFIAGQLDIPFKVDSLWPGGVLGALFIGIVSWALSKVSDTLTSIGAHPSPPRPREVRPAA